jgi:hypothetical protein
VRIALITISENHGGGGAEPLVAGRPVARHQLDFALAQGCGKILCLGHGAAPEAIALRHAAEGAAVQFQVVRGVRDLPAAVRGDDQLLVLAQGLLPESRLAFDLLKEGEGLLVLPAEAGWSAGFERLDLTASWGGAMVLPGRYADRLDQLPDDAEPVAGLLRIARQAKVPERFLPEAELSERRWQIVRTSEAARALEPGWLRRRLPAPSPFRPTAWLAGAILRRSAGPLLGTRRTAGALLAGAAVGLVGALAAGWFGLPVLAFAILAMTALLIEAREALGLLGRSIFLVPTKPSRLLFVLRLMWDGALVAVGVLAIEGSRAHRTFTPLVAVGLLRIAPPWPLTGWRALAGDRGLVALLLALASALGLAEAGFMVLSLALILFRLRAPGDRRGWLTRP